MYRSCQLLLLGVALSLASVSAAQTISAALQVAPPAQDNAASAALARLLAPAQAANSITLTLADAITRARANNPAFQAALVHLGIARENRLQAQAALLPSVDYNNGFIYTEGNGTLTGRFVANNGVHEYISEGAVTQNFGLAQFAEYRRSAAEQALARAKAEIAARGLTVAVVQAYYGLQAANTKATNTRAAADEAQRFLQITRELEQGGEVAHSDVIKAQIQAETQQRAVEDAALAAEQARLNLAVLVFPNFFQDFTLADALDQSPALLPMADVQQMAEKNNPELAAAFAAVNVAARDVQLAEAAHIPMLSLNYWYGLDANQFARYAPQGFPNLGYSAAATLNIPVWHWGAIESKIRQAELQEKQAKVELSAAQRTAIADLTSFYAEAKTARGQLDSLRSSMDLAAESLRLTNLRYKAGEASALEVVDAQNTLTTARIGYSDGLLRYHVALANLQTLTGSF